MDIRESQNLASDTSRHFWEIARLYFIKKLLFRYCNKIDILTDIGCGDCFVIQELSNSLLQCRFIGIDTALNDTKMSLIKKRMQNNLRLSLYSDDKNIPIPPADVILLCDVLEHIEDEQDFLQKVMSLLKSDGSVIVTVPAFQCIFTEHDHFLHHFRRYNRKQLCKKLKNAGFEIRCSGYIFFSLLLPRILQKILHISAAKEQSLHPKWHILNSLAALILKIDASVCFLLSRLNLPLPGLSCFAVITRCK